ncbi:MAG: nucleotidyltransferase domain-containing protein [Lachnospiraceae bacterium]|nr:nucleotidyltransferase domain-containing protein [Lachnospiraceae bacterium]MBQ9198957.1 nucleotidyltransferase domain-containing protein [Lachnospiraceae bacterium]
MVTDEIQKVTSTVVGKLVELLGNKIYKIILYGSYARGDFDTESDIDIMILINGTDEDVLKYRKDVRRIANDVGLDNNILVSLLIKPRQSFEEWSDVVVFYKNVIKEGVTLYE